MCGRGLGVRVGVSGGGRQRFSYVLVVGGITQYLPPPSWCVGWGGGGIFNGPFKEQNKKGIVVLEYLITSVMSHYTWNISLQMEPPHYSLGHLITDGATSLQLEPPHYSWGHLITAGATPLHQEDPLLKSPSLHLDIPYTHPLQSERPNHA
ncbi:hypothetical protein Btru_004565 [Bulinus truncatus]|nr:hypothetical protein Btru_004565 [Bulinus truncatus]